MSIVTLAEPPSDAFLDQEELDVVMHQEGCRLPVKFVNLLCTTAEPPSDAFLDQEELDFVCGLDALMEAAHYHRLSQAEWETAEREEFTVRKNGWTRADLTVSGAVMGSMHYG